MYSDDASEEDGEDTNETKEKNIDKYKGR